MALVTEKQKTKSRPFNVCVLDKKYDFFHATEVPSIEEKLRTTSSSEVEPPKSKRTRSCEVFLEHITKI